MSNSPGEDSNSPLAFCAHELAHALAAWTLGWSVSRICLRGRKGVAAMPSRAGGEDAEARYVIAVAGMIAERVVVGVADPKGCGTDDEVCARFRVHELPATERATALVSMNQDALRCAAEILVSRLKAPRSDERRILI